MKKLWIVALLALCCAPRRAHAAVTDPEVVQEKTVVVHFSTTVPVSSTGIFDLVSLGGTGFPHLDRGELDVSYINVSIDKLAATVGSTKVGVVSYTGVSTGTAVYFYGAPFLKNVSNSSNNPMTNSADAFYRCKVISGKTASNSDVDGTTPFILSNDKRQGSTLLASTVSLPAPTGTVNPRPGDIVMEVTNSDASNTFTVVVDIWYHSEP